MQRSRVQSGFKLLVVVATLFVAVLALPGVAQAAYGPQSPPPSVTPPAGGGGTPTPPAPGPGGGQTALPSVPSSGGGGGTLPLTGADVLTLTGIGIGAIGIGLLLHKRRPLPTRS